MVSVDTNPAQGSFTFQVGLIANATAPNVTGLAQSLASKQSGSQAVTDAYGVLRGGLYAGIMLLVGAVVFSVFVWPKARGVRRTGHLVWLGWGLTLFATLAMVLVQGIYGAGLGFGALFHSDLIRQVLGTQFGHLSILRLVILAGAFPLLRRLLHPGADPAVLGLRAAAGRGARRGLGVHPRAERPRRHQHRQLARGARRRRAHAGRVHLAGWARGARLRGVPRTRRRPAPGRGPPVLAHRRRVRHRA